MTKFDCWSLDYVKFICYAHWNYFMETEIEDKVDEELWNLPFKNILSSCNPYKEFE